MKRLLNLGVLLILFAGLLTASGVQIALAHGSGGQDAPSKAADEPESPDFTPDVQIENTPWGAEDDTDAQIECWYPWVPNPFPHGQCTWWAAEARPDVRSSARYLNAKDWVRLVPSYFRGREPRVRDIAIFQPGVQGADGRYGHVAYVYYVYPGQWQGRTWFYVLEANFKGANSAYHFTHDGVRITGRWAYNEAGVEFLSRICWG